MLQQTRVAQGKPYYFAFLEAFPTVHDLAAASEDQVLKLWQGLGYYSRARNLHATSKFVANELSGVFPDTYEGLLKLKGVGDYTASAIASICYNRPTAVVDGNVYRVLARYFGVETPINSTKGAKEFKALANELIDSKDPATFNQAIMEFGAVQCKPQSPNCQDCPLNDGCVALQKKQVGQLPVKLKKQKIRRRHFNYLVVIGEDQKTVLQQRTQKGIWYRMYEFPLIESNEKIDREKLMNHEAFENLSKGKLLSVTRHNDEEIVHKLSHQHIYTTFWIVSVETIIDTSAIELTSISEYPVPILIANFIDGFLKEETKSMV